MTLLNWIPEILILIQFSLVLGGTSFRITSSHFLIFLSGLLSIFGFIYYGVRPDLMNFESPLLILSSDAVSRYCRLISLLLVAVGSWQLALHSGLSVVAKLRGLMGMIAGAFFLCLMSESNHLVSTYIGVVGLFVSGMNLILVESHSSPAWTRYFKKTTFSILLITLVFLTLFLFSEFLAGTGYLDGFIAGMKTAPEMVRMFMGFILLFFGFWILHGVRVVGNAPLALPYFNLFCFFAAIIFWIRVEVPFFSQFGLFNKMTSQSVLGVLMTSASLRYSLASARTQDSTRWLSNVLSALFSLSLYPLLLTSGDAFKILFTLLIGLLMTTTLLGRAFLGGPDRNRWFSVVAVLAGVGFPPLTLGFQYFLVLKQLHAAELAPFAIAFLISWFFIAIAAVQMITQILRDRRVGDAVLTSSGHRADWTLLTLVVLCVIMMTAFGESLIERLNTQPVPNLW